MMCLVPQLMDLNWACRCDPGPTADLFLTDKATVSPGEITWGISYATGTSVQIMEFPLLVVF